MRQTTLRTIAAQDPRLRTFLEMIWEEARALQWAQVGQTTQDALHCERVEGNALRLLVKAGRQDLCMPTVAFILSAAAALHDIGKIECDESLRTVPDHGREGRERILNVLRPDLFPDAEFRHIVPDVVGVHASAPFTRVAAGERQCNGIGVWPRSIAAVFRLADMLDMTSIRAPESYCRFQGRLFVNHRSVWLPRGAITGWDVSHDLDHLIIQARPPSPEAARAVKKLLQLTNRDVHREHAIALQALRFTKVQRRREVPVNFQLPTTFTLTPEDSRVVERMARQQRHGYVVRDREIHVSLRAAGCDIRERLELSVVANTAFGQLAMSFRTRYWNRGFDTPLAGDLQIEARGPAPSLDDAMSAFTNRAITLLPILATAANATIDNVDVEIAFDDTPDLDLRDFYQKRIPDEPIVPEHRMRRLRVAETVAFAQAALTHNEAHRLHRAMEYYRGALANWRRGYETLAVANLSWVWKR
jgi:hypothetical protein